MNDDEHLDAIREYVRDNRETFTREAMRERLIRDGATPEAIDLVLDEEQAAAAERAAVPPAPVDDEARSRARWTMVAVAAASLFGYLLILGAAVISAVAGASAGAFFAIFVAGIALEVFIALQFARRGGVTDRKLVTAIALTPVAVAALLSGACFAVFNA